MLVEMLSIFKPGITFNTIPGLEENTEHVGRSFTYRFAYIHIFQLNDEGLWTRIRERVPGEPVKVVKLSRKILILQVI